MPSREHKLLRLILLPLSTNPAQHTSRRYWLSQEIPVCKKDYSCFEYFKVPFCNLIPHGAAEFSLRLHCFQSCSALSLPQHWEEGRGLILPLTDREVDDDPVCNEEKVVEE